MGECVAHLAYKEKKAEQVTLECWVNKEKREIWEILGKWDHQVYKELQDWPDSLASRVYPECVENLDLKETLVLLAYQDTRDPLVNKEIQEFQVQKGKEATEDQLDHKEILENLAHPDQKDRLEKMETQDLQENKDLLETQENVVLGAQQANQEAQDLKVYQEWKEDLVLLATPYQLLRQPCLEERQFLGHLAHKDQWDHLVHLEREVLPVEEGLKEEGVHLDHQVLLVVQEDRVFLEEPEIQGLQAKMVVQ